MTIIGCVGILWLMLWQFKKWSELDDRLARADPSLLNDSSLDSEEVIQAPAGSVVLPYALAVDLPMNNQPVQQVQQVQQVQLIQTDQ